MNCGYCGKELGVIGYHSKIDESKKIKFEKPFCHHCGHKLKQKDG